MITSSSGFSMFIAAGCLLLICTLYTQRLTSYGCLSASLFISHVATVKKVSLLLFCIFKKKYLMKHLRSEKKLEISLNRLA